MIRVNTLKCVSARVGVCVCSTVQLDESVRILAHLYASDMCALLSMCGGAVFYILREFIQHFHRAVSKQHSTQQFSIRNHPS